MSVCFMAHTRTYFKNFYEKNLLNSLNFGGSIFYCSG